MSLHDHRLTAAVLSRIENRYPRTISSNARLGSHGSGSENHIVTVATDSGASGWGLVKVKLKAGGSLRDAMHSAGIDGPNGRRFFDLFEPDAAGIEGLLGRRIGDLFDPGVGVIDDAALPLDFALHDLAGHLLGVPVHALLGGHGERSVTCYDGAIYFDDLEPPAEPRGIDAVLANCADDFALGYRDFKLKIGRGARWMDAAAGQQRDIDVTRAVRDAYPQARILVDANNSYSAPGFLTYLDSVSECDLFWVEEPFAEAEADLTALRSYLDRAGARTLIADGEGSESDDAHLLDLASKGLIDVIQFNIVDYGLTAWRQVMPLLEQLGVQASPHAWGSPVNTLYAAQVACGLGNVIALEGIPGRTSGADTSGYVLSDGVLSVPDEPGFGMPLIDPAQPAACRSPRGSHAPRSDGSISSTTPMSFRDRVRARSEVLAGTFLNLGSPLTAEIIALAGFDWVAVDLEHGAGGELEALHQLQAIAHTGTAGLVRIESASGSRIGHALDSGADGVIVPQVRSAAEAAEVVSACRYAGRRGVARYNRAWQWGMRGGALGDADARVTCCIQIERSDALADADAIAATDGVDVLFVGPADLGHALGIDGGADHPDLLAAAATVSEAALRHGKAAGILTANVAQIEHYHRLGFTFLGCSADSALLMARAHEVSAAIHSLGASS